MNTPSLTEQLADWLLAEQKRAMPASALASAEYYLLDWLGSALAGRVTEPGKALIAYAQGQPDGACSLIGVSGSGSAETAALVNGGLSQGKRILFNKYKLLVRRVKYNNLICCFKLFF